MPFYKAIDVTNLSKFIKYLFACDWTYDLISSSVDYKSKGKQNKNFNFLPLFQKDI